MNRIEVKLLHITPKEVIINAIANPYNKENLREDEEKAFNVIKAMCLNPDKTEKHGSVLEHIVTQWEIIGSSRLELQEHMRHRVASPTVRSTRYTLKEFVEAYEVNPHEAMQDYFVMLHEFMFPDRLDYLSYKTMYQSAIHSFYICYKELNLPNKEKQDMVKYLLPEGFRTRFTWTINLRSLLNFIRLRTDKHAHFEIRHIANLIKDELNKTYVSKVMYD